MAASRRHHYVPEMLSKRFADSNGYLWLFDREDARHGIQKVTPGGAFWEPHLNTQILPDGSRDTSVETFFGQRIETPADVLLGQLVEAVRTGVPPILDNAARKLLEHFFFYQFKRPPEAFRRMVPDSEIDAFVTAVRHRVEARLGRALTADEIAETNEDTALATILRNGRVRAVAAPLDHALEGLGQCGLFFSVPERGAFVITSNPVVKLADPGSRYLGDGNSLAVLPVASDVAICFGSRDRDGTLLRVGHKAVRKFNLTAINQSASFASCNSKLTASLTRPR